MSAAATLPAGVEAAEVATSRLRTNVLRAGPGTAPVLVLVHGNVSSARFFAETMAVLGERYHCVAPDLRGFGGSEPAPVAAQRGVRDFADDVHALLTETGLLGRPLHLLGWSLGGGVALQYAIDHQGAVASIVLESPMSPYGFGGTRDLAGTPCWPDYAGSGGGTASPEMVRRIAAGDGNYPGDQTGSANWPGTAPGEHGVNNAISPRYCDLSGFAGVPDRPDVLWLRGDSDQIVSDTSLADLGHLGALGALPGWPGPDVFPAQPMIGQVRAVLDHYQAAGGKYTELVLANCGHSPHLEHPAEFESAVTTFLGAHG